MSDDFYLCSSLLPFVDDIFHPPLLKRFGTDRKLRVCLRAGYQKVPASTIGTIFASDWTYLNSINCPYVHVFLFISVCAGSEILTGKVRVLYASLGVCLCYALGFVILPLFAYFLRDWKSLLLALSLPGLLYIPLWWWVVHYFTFSSLFVFLLSTVLSHAQTIPVNLSLVMKSLVHTHSPVLLIQICFIKLGASVECLGGNAAVLLCLPWNSGSSGPGQYRGLLSLPHPFSLSTQCSIKSLG